MDSAEVLTMMQQDFGLLKQEVRFELQDSIRRLENIRTLSGTMPSLRSLSDSHTPLGHRVPAMIGNIQMCQTLLSAYKDRGEGLTFADLRRINPTQCELFTAAIVEVRRLDHAVRTNSLEAFGREYQ